MAGVGTDKPDQRGQTSTEPVVRQHSGVLWVVLELHHEEVPV